MAAFTPGKTTTLAVGTASAQINIDPNAPNVMLLNAGANVAFVQIGTGAQTATVANSFPLAPNGSIVLTKGVGADTLAAIAATAGNTLYATTGNGG